MDYEVSFDPNDWSVLDDHLAEQDEWHSNALALDNAFTLADANCYTHSLNEEG